MNRTFITILVISYSILVHSQIAEKLFREKYSKIGLVVGLNNMSVKNEANAANFQWTKSNAVTFGLNYNFYQYKNYNFNVSVLYSRFDLNDSFTVASNTGEAFTYQGSSGPYALFLLPVEAEYFIKMSNNTFFTISSGIEIAFNQYGSDEGSSASGGGTTGNVTQINSTEFARDFPLYFGANIGAAIAIDTKPMLLKFNVKYHKQFEDFIYRANSTINVNGDLSAATQNLTGDYFGFGVSIFPNKNFFR